MDREAIEGLIFKEFPDLRNLYTATWRLKLRGLSGKLITLATSEDEMTLRRLLWLRHDSEHSDYFYGDDGEMQCNHQECFIDFRRDSVNFIESRLEARGMKKLLKAKKK